jgi:hypothetical protein
VVIEGLITRVEGVFPEAEESSNQGWSLRPVKARTPVPVFVILTLDGETGAAPNCPEKLNPVGLTVSTAGDGVTVRVAEETLLGSAWLVAVTVTKVAKETLGG